MPRPGSDLGPLPILRHDVLNVRDGHLDGFAGLIAERRQKERGLRPGLAIALDSRAVGLRNRDFVVHVPTHATFKFRVCHERLSSQQARTL